MLHAGHLEILYEASRQADLLVVALNTDESIKQYKSPLRPIIPLVYRLQMMATLEFVSYVTWFDETDPRRVLSVIKPSVQVMAQNTEKNYVSLKLSNPTAAYDHIVKLVDGLSTSQV